MLRRKTDDCQFLPQTPRCYRSPRQTGSVTDTMARNPALQQQLENAKAKHGDTAPQVVPVLKHCGEAQHVYTERCFLFRMHHVLGLHRTGENASCTAKTSSRRGW
jgi:hypothetical protein